MKKHHTLIGTTVILFALSSVAQAQFTFTTNTDDTLTITSYTGSNTVLIIPDKINGYPVALVGDDAFAYNNNLTSVTISTNVTSIGTEAFRACKNLATLTISSSVTNIGGGAFAWCTSLTNITIPSSVTYIDIAAFYYCTSLSGVYFQSNAPNIYTNPPGSYGLDVFEGDYGATAFFFPGTTGWDCDFGGLPTWSSYNITNDGTITIAAYAGFGGSVVVPATLYGLPVASIGTNAFALNSSLTNVIIPGSVTSIGDEAFYLCTNLNEILFQGNAPNIGSFVFHGITHATVYFLPDTTGWGSSLGGLTAWTLYPFTYTTNNGTITITGYTGGSGTVVIPTTITGLPVAGIGTNAFAYNTSLTSVTIPSCVTNLGSLAFEWCTGLKRAYFQGNALTAPYLDAFYGDTNLIVYYLPGTLGWGTTYEGHPTALWLPELQMTQANFGVPTNPFAFKVNWASGNAIIVETCSNFINPVWQPVRTNTLTNGSFYFSDSQWTNHASSFYRVRSP